jgi:hypothetical protein
MRFEFQGEAIVEKAWLLRWIVLNATLLSRGSATSGVGSPPPQGDGCSKTLYFIFFLKNKNKNFEGVGSVRDIIV